MKEQVKATAREVNETEISDMPGRVSYVFCLCPAAMSESLSISVPMTTLLWAVFALCGVSGTESGQL